ARAQLAVDRLRLERARALLGDVDNVLTELAPGPADDPITAARIDIARGKILLAADHAAEARDLLERVERDARGRGGKPMPLAAPERTDLELTVCEAQLATADRCKASYHLDALVKPLHPRAPVRARLAIAQAGSDAVRQLTSLRSQYLLSAIDILLDAGAA